MYRLDPAVPLTIFLSSCFSVVCYSPKLCRKNLCCVCTSVACLAVSPRQGVGRLETEITEYQQRIEQDASVICALEERLNSVVKRNKELDQEMATLAQQNIGEFLTSDVSQIIGYNQVTSARVHFASIRHTQKIFWRFFALLIRSPVAHFN